MDISSAQYISDIHDASQNVLIKAVINGVMTYVPLDAANTEYDEIQRQVAAGTLTIEDAD
jgi:hypothetical protein